MHNQEHKQCEQVVSVRKDSIALITAFSNGIAECVQTKKTTFGFMPTL